MPSTYLLKFYGQSFFRTYSSGIDSTFQLALNTTIRIGRRSRPLLVTRSRKLGRESRNFVTNDINIFTLAQVIVHGMPCRPTVQLCSRVVLMRAIHVECSGGEKYWNFIDRRLAVVRQLAGSDFSKAVRIFRDVLKTDRQTYGMDEDYEIGDVVADDWQQRVDDVVGGR
ncbi:hypothetical protein GALMADRAFT_217270 [Galerina marginata CBS 339.88]|uniref:Uncharacterized protein n=1 Tax=Galerina marginata (strain CBS 339.88) TaxID=685588 RepID=A0A067S7T2_GALM3|nr:hypothetical protein GALMADRAFT_217270 [Galerina marginata CBS 339.88]